MTSHDDTRTLALLALLNTDHTLTPDDITEIPNLQELLEWYEQRKELNAISERVSELRLIQQQIAEIYNEFSDQDFQVSQFVNVQTYDEWIEFEKVVNRERRTDPTVGIPYIFLSSHTSFLVMELLSFIPPTLEPEYEHTLSLTWTYLHSVPGTIHVATHTFEVNWILKVSQSNPELDDDGRLITEIKSVMLTFDLRQVREPALANLPSLDQRTRVCEDLPLALTDSVGCVFSHHILYTTNSFLAQRNIEIDDFTFPEGLVRTFIDHDLLLSGYVVQSSREFLPTDDYHPKNISNELPPIHFQSPQSTVVNNPESINLLTQTRLSSSIPDIGESTTVLMKTQDSIEYTPFTMTVFEERAFNLHHIQLIVESFIFDVKCTHLRAQHAIIHDMISDLLLQGQELAGEFQDFLSQATFSNTSIIDDLLATTIRYEAKEVNLWSERALCFFPGWRVQCQGYAPFNIISPYRTLGFNETDVTVNSFFANNPTLYPNSVSATVTNTPLLSYQDEFIIYQDEDYRVFARCSMSQTVIEDPDHATPLDRISSQRFNTNGTQGSYFDGDLTAASVGLMTNTRHGGMIPVPALNHRIVLIVDTLIFVHLHGINVPIFDEGTIRLTIATPNVTSNNRRTTTTTLRNGQSGEVIGQNGRLPAIFFDVRETFTWDMFNHSGEFVYVTVEPQDRWDVDTTSTILTDNQNITRTRFNRRSTMPTSYRSSTLGNVQIDAQNTFEQYHNLAQTRTNTMNALSTLFTFHSTGLADTAQLFTGHQLLNAMQTVFPNDSIQWSQLHPVMSTTDSLTNGRVNPFQILTSFALNIEELSLKFRTAMPPDSIGLRRIYDSSVHDLMAVVESIHLDIYHIYETLEDLTIRMEIIENQVEQILNALNPGFWQQMLSSVVGMLADIAVIAGVGMVAKLGQALIQGAMGGVRIMVHTFGRSPRLLDTLKRQLASSRATPIEAVNKHASTHALARRAKLGDRTRWSDFPAGINADDNPRLNNNFSLSMLLPEFAMRSRAIATAKRGENRLLMNVPNDHSGPLSTLEVHYRPLTALPSQRLADNLYKRIDFKNLRSQYQFRANKVRANKPAHAYASLSTTYQTPSGTLVEKKQVFGVGEYGGLGANELGGRVNGIMWEHDVMRTSNGKMVTSLRSHQHSGYTDDDVRRMFREFYKLDQTPDNIRVDYMWHKLVNGVDATVKSADLAHRQTFASDFMHHAVQDIIRNPPTSRYNLASRNCQHFTNDLVRYIQGYSISDTWGLNIQGRLDRGGFRRVFDLIGETEARVNVVSYDGAHYILNHRGLVIKGAGGVSRISVKLSIVN
ncbi:minor capsid protein [Dendrolimus punctatus cypovirus 22]|uniref:minor capsid protein n=1 Tax=Dendrolimus punctatus cypovirus 22 TaxID=1577776 RepID=UPI00053FC821|nr:minor capsid protein [Dendrolimus punctatus cypovirus 22]AIY60596.1 minor capsid protein [Dendrolimus punctatus cypovirus 22]